MKKSNIDVKLTPNNKNSFKTGTVYYYMKYTRVKIESSSMKLLNNCFELILFKCFCSTNH